MVRYSDPQRRASGITYNGRAGWTDIGNLMTKFEYPDTIVSNLTWTGIGELYDPGSGNKLLRFTLPTTQFISSDVTSITPISGLAYMNSIDDVDKFNDYAFANTGITTITKSLSGLNFEVITPISSARSQPVRKFAYVSITGLTLQFNKE